MFYAGFNIIYVKYPSLLTHTHASWVNQPIYAIRLKTVQYKEPLLILFSKVVLSALYGVSNSIYVQSLSQFTNSWDLGESTQLCVKTESGVER